MKGKIAINRGLCKGCEYCIHACPQMIITMDNKFNSSGFFPAKVINMNKCTGCSVCAEVCPEIAIEVWRLTEE